MIWCGKVEQLTNSIFTQSCHNKWCSKIQLQSKISIDQNTCYKNPEWIYKRLKIWLCHQELTRKHCTIWWLWFWEGNWKNFINFTQLSNINIFSSRTGDSVANEERHYSPHSLESTFNSLVNIFNKNFYHRQILLDPSSYFLRNQYI